MYYIDYAKILEGNVLFQLRSMGARDQIKFLI